MCNVFICMVISLSQVCLNLSAEAVFLDTSERFFAYQWVLSVRIPAPLVRNLPPLYPVMTPSYTPYLSQTKRVLYISVNVCVSYPTIGVV